MKAVIVIVVVIALLGVGGFVFKNAQKSKPQTAAMTKEASVQTSGGVFSSIKDALSKSLSLECKYNDTKGVPYTTYIKAGAVRVQTATSQDANQMGNIIMKDKKMYMWNETTKTGLTYTLQVPSGMPTSTQTKAKTTISETPNNDQQESLMAQMEKYKDSCKPSVISDSLFTPPTDVKFQDYSQMMNGVQKSMQSITPGQGSSAEYQKAMENVLKQLSPTQ